MEHSTFFNSISGDRKYKAEDWDRHLKDLIANGVFVGGSNLQVVPGEDSMAVAVQIGSAWVNGKHYFNDQPKPFVIAAADGVLNRIDRLVLCCDFSARTITTQMKKGAFAGSAVPPSIQRDANKYELCLADISVPAGTTTITAALITDTRLNTELCGIVTGLIDQVDTTTFYNQIAADLAQFKSANEADFDAWFESIKDILDEATAGNLLNLINMVSADLNAHTSDTSSHITTCTHTKTGTVHNLAVPEGAKNLAFLATASITAGDTWTVNGQPTTVKSQNNSALPAGLFALGLWVVGVRLSDDGAMLVFNSPGALPNPSSLTVSTGNGGQTGSYNGSSAMSISIPKLVVSSSAPSGTLPAGTIWGVY